MLQFLLVNNTTCYLDYLLYEELPEPNIDDANNQMIELNAAYEVRVSLATISNTQMVTEPSTSIKYIY